MHPYLLLGDTFVAIFLHLFTAVRARMTIVIPSVSKVFFFVVASQVAGDRDCSTRYQNAVPPASRARVVPVENLLYLAYSGISGQQSLDALDRYSWGLGAIGDSQRLQR